MRSAKCPQLSRLLHPGALIIRIGFGGIFYYSCNKEPQNPILSIKAPTLPLLVPGKVNVAFDASEVDPASGWDS